MKTIITWTLSNALRSVYLISFRLTGLCFCFLLYLLINTQPIRAQGHITYNVSFPNAVHHEARVTVTVSQAPKKTLTFWMSRSSPGRYALHEFAKNVYTVSATNGNGNPLPTTRLNNYAWNVQSEGGTVKVSYTLYADHPGGTYSGIDLTHAHLNMPATFMWVQGMENRPITIHFHIPENSGWKVATQLKPTGDPAVFTAPGMQYFMDSPTELSDFMQRTWKLSSNGHTYTYRMDIHHEGSKADATNFAHMAERVVKEEKAIYGELPHYDYGTYTFIADYLPYIYGDGMEHRNSTIIMSRQPLSTHALNDLSTLAHEFFHSWNMERIRSKAIEPFDFTKADMSKELWFGEGFTSYYDKLVLRRAGFFTNEQYAQRMGHYLDFVINSPGHTFFSPVQMSMQSPFVDAATSIDAQNKDNTYITYYLWGSVIGMGLDLTLRTRYHKTLDDYMRAMWHKYGQYQKNETPQKPYTMKDLQKTLGEVTNDSPFAAKFFKKYIEGRKLMDYKSLLAKAGFSLQKANPGSAVIQFGHDKLEFENNTAKITSNTLIGSPLYKTGLDRGDVIIKIGNNVLHDVTYLQAFLADHKPGDTVTIEYTSRGHIYHKNIILAEDPHLELIPYEDLGKSLTNSQKELRNGWLGDKIQ